VRGRALSFRSAAVGDDKDQVLRYVEQLEENVEAAFRRGEVSFLKRFELLTTETSVTAKMGQMVVAGATLTLTLPVSTRDNAGLPVAVAVTAGTVTVKAATGQTLNGSATASVAAADGMRTFWSIGDRWMFEA